MFSIANSGATTMSLVSSNWNLATASSDGGFARIGGTTSDVTMDSSSSFYNFGSSTTGGAFRFDSTTSSKFTMKGTSSIDYLSANSKGGTLYFNSPSNYVIIKGTSTISRSSSVDGGVIYTSTIATLVDIDIS